MEILDKDKDLTKEQEVLDEHDDTIAELAICIQKLISTCSAPSDPNPRKIQSRRITRLEKSLSTACEEIKTLSERSDDTCLICQHEEQLLDFKRELEDIRKCLLPLDLNDDDELSVLHIKMEKALFNNSLEIKRQLKDHVSTPTTSESKGVQLPKLDVPTFDGNILNWRSFWEQFQDSVHDRSNLAESEKLVYLQHALKNGSAKQAIEGLSHSGVYYSETIVSRHVMTAHGSFTRLIYV